VTRQIHEIIYELLIAVGEDPGRPGLEGTPDRIERMLTSELLRGYSQDPQEILKPLWEHPHGDMVLVKDIPFYSMCEHHMLPFHGVAHVAYIPHGRIVGISKIARLVEGYSRRLQIQERLASQVADAIAEHVSPDVAVVIDAEHMCMVMRGVQKPGSRTVTSAMRGAFFDDARARQEFLQLIDAGVR